MKSPLSIILLCLGQVLFAQTPDTVRARPVQWSGRLHRGFIIPHSREIVDVSHSKPYGLEFNIHWLLDDEKSVRQSGLIAQRGLALFAVDFDNPEVLGFSIAAVPYVEPMILPWRRLYGSFQFGLGPVYLSRVYHKVHNPQNLFFSLPISLWAMVNAGIYLKTTPQWTISGGLNYNHISNGGMKNPNKGMNFPTFHLGLQYSPSNFPIRRPLKNTEWKKGKRNFHYILLNASVKNVAAEPGFPKILPACIYGVQSFWSRRVGRLSALSAGMEWIFDGYERILRDRRGDRASAWRGGLLVGHELTVGKVRFSMHAGPYLFHPGRTVDGVYQRYGLFYRLGKRMLIGGTLKAHRHVADVFDLRAGYIW